MSAYLVDHVPRRSQYRNPRRATPTGTIVLHSAENAPDLRPPDDGAENIAEFIRNRSDPGSYHVIVDQDSQVQLVPFEWEAYGDGTGSNRWAIHLSVALSAHNWATLTDDQRLWYMASLAKAARSAADWLRFNHAISVPARRLSKATATEPGFCSHQDRETWFGTPGRRTDPWRNDEAMWDLFLSLYADTYRPRTITKDRIVFTKDEAAMHVIAAFDDITGSWPTPEQCDEWVAHLTFDGRNYFRLISLLCKEQRLKALTT